MLSIAIQEIANRQIQHFKVIYLGVRSLIVGDLVEMTTHMILTLLKKNKNKEVFSTYKLPQEIPPQVPYLKEM